MSWTDILHLTASVLTVVHVSAWLGNLAASRLLGKR